MDLLVPSDTAAVLDWGLDTPFTSLDKPSLAVTIVTVNGERSLRTVGPLTLSVPTASTHLRW